MQHYHDSLSVVSRQKTPVAYAFTYLNSPATVKQYPKRLQAFFEFIGLQEGDLEQQGLAFIDEVKHNGQQWAQEQIVMFMDSIKRRVKQNTINDERRKKDAISASTVKNYIHPIKLFYETHDLPLINWKRIFKALPKARKSSNDRTPTREEIRKVIQAKDRRVKPIVLVMCSSGIRLGAWDYLRWKHVIPQKNEKGEVVAAKLIVYTEEYEEYYSFITPEAYNALLDYMDFRALHGEKITGESWLIRDIWQTVDIKIKHGKFGLATSPKKLPSLSIKMVLIRALYEQGVREALPDGVRRHEWKGAHGFRKFFKTHAEQVMNHANVELLLGHTSETLQRSYYKPTEKDVLADYLKAVDNLTIDYDKNTLKKQVEDLTEKSKEDSYIIKSKLVEKEKEIEAAAREAEQTKKMLEEIRLQQEIQRAEHEIDQANHQNLARYVMGLEKAVIINVYDEKDGTQGLLELGAKLRREREAREKKHEEWHSRERNKKLAKTI